MGFLYLLLFVVFISTLIVIHELGHLTMAKIFKVYCLEFSVGMGPSKEKARAEKLNILLEQFLLVDMFQCILKVLNLKKVSRLILQDL